MTSLDIAFLERFGRHGPVGKTLGMLVRTAFVAPPGKTFVWGDWSAIEARVLPWLAASPGADRVLDIFRTNDQDSSLPDIYEITAGKLLGKPSSEVSKKERQSHGKVPTLSLGFGGGLGALQAMAINYRVYFDAESGKALVESWRADNSWAPEFWGKFRTHQEDGSVIESSGLWGAVHMALRNPGTPYTAGRVAYVYDPSYLSGTLFCALPDSRLLTYPDIKVRTKVVKDKATGEESEKTALWYRKGYGWSALWHGKCLAADTMVLTSRGWMPIACVWSDDSLWDGEEWVPHDGLMFQGCKLTMPVDGVRMTPDHKVMTDAGWREAKDSLRFNRAAVRLPDGAKTRTTGTAPESCDVGRTLRLRDGEDGLQRGLAAQEQEAIAGLLWLPDGDADRGGLPHPRHDKAPRLRGVAVDAGSLSIAVAPSLEELRRAWHHRLPRMADLLRGLLGRHGADVSIGADAGAQGQQRRLLKGELRVGDVQGAGEQQAEQSEEPVYDLMNAGPRRRFTVLGEHGPMLVHNCAENVTQAVAGSILRETLDDLELAPEVKLGLWETIGHTHDEALIMADDAPDTVAAARAHLESEMLRPREWRLDLPLAVEVSDNWYYSKDPTIGE